MTKTQIILASVCVALAVTAPGGPLAFLARVWSATSQWLNTVLLQGEPNESICGRAYRMAAVKRWYVAMRALDVLMRIVCLGLVNRGQHCRGAYSADREWAKKAAAWPERVPPGDY